jgi:peptide/nickel transport system substrate-binding protein
MSSRGTVATIRCRAIVAVALFSIWSTLLSLTIFAPASTAQAKPAADQAVMEGEVGQPGGHLTIALRTEPKTLNPILSVDLTSREVIAAMNSDLIHINRQTQKTEPALAKSWTASPDGRRYVVQLRHGIKFSDGSAFTADDVVFSFQLYLDENLHSPQRDLLLVDGKPVVVKKIDGYTVEFTFAKPYAAAERLFDGLAMLPSHRLQQAYKDGKVGQIWGTNSKVDEIVGLGAFRLKEYVPGQRLVLERNANYWKIDPKGNRLPYLSEIAFEFVANEDAQVIRFQTAETQILERVNADNFTNLQKDAKAKNECLDDLGAGLEYVFLLLNQNHMDASHSNELARKQTWFRDVRFRRAISLAVDRKGMVRLAYNGRATPLWSQVTPGNKLWVNETIPHPGRSLEDSRKLLGEAGFSWNSNGGLLDAQKNPVAFTLLVSSSNAQRTKLATIAQDDLKQLGMDVQVVPMEFRAMIDRILNTKDYDAAVMNLVSGDADPTSEMNVWLSSGETHLWDLGEAKAATPWEAELDQLMEAQLTATDAGARKKLYDRVQSITAEQLPYIFLISPNILVGASGHVGNFRPAILDPYALWNAEQLFLRPTGGSACR